MSDTIALTTPAQINMWVLLSRRSQLKLHLKGYRVPGIVKACRRDVPGCENARTAKDCVVPLEFAISEAGGTIDYSLVNVHVMRKAGGMFHDRGIVSSMAEVEADPTLVSLYTRGMLEIVLTLDEPRAKNGEIYVPA